MTVGVIMLYELNHKNYGISQKEMQTLCDIIYTHIHVHKL